MITASSWLEGPGFLGLRRLAREVADEIIVVDLHGDNKGTRKDENVFDIESPVAIVTLVRHGVGDRSVPAVVRYASYRGTRAEKLAALADLASSTVTLQVEEATTDWHASFIPASGGADWASYPKLVDLFPMQQPGMMINRTWPTAPDPDTLVRRWQAFVASGVPHERSRCYVTPSTGRRITTKVPGLRPLAELKVGDAHEPIVRFGMRSFDRQWIFHDPRLIALERPALWSSLSDKQVFLTTMTNTSLGRGPGATVTTAVPDKHFFSGRGGKDVIPLYRDARGTPNVDRELLLVLNRRHQTGDAGHQEVTAEQLFAYTFGVLAGTDYSERFRDALATPGPRVPLTADRQLFARMVSHGQRLLWLQTFGQRYGKGNMPMAGVGWKTEPTRLPEDKSQIVFDSATESLRVADGVLHGVSESVWQFAVSGMDVIPKWLGYRLAKPAGRAARSDSPLDYIRPTAWSSEWSAELVEVVSAIKETLKMRPDGVALLDEIVAGPLIAKDELPPVPAALRLPPGTKRNGSAVPALFGDDQ